MKAPYGWTVVRNNELRAKNDTSSQCPFIVYKRDCPATKEHFAADLAPFTHPTKAAATKAGEAGNYAYKDA